MNFMEFSVGRGKWWGQREYPSKNNFLPFNTGHAQTPTILKMLHSTLILFIPLSNTSCLVCMMLWQELFRWPWHVIIDPYSRILLSAPLCLWKVPATTLSEVGEKKDTEKCAEMSKSWLSRRTQASRREHKMIAIQWSWSLATNKVPEESPVRETCLRGTTKA